MTAVYKYFRFQGTKSISVTVRGSVNGRLLLKLALDSEAVGVVAVTLAKEWTKYSGTVDIPDGDHALCFCYEGKGKLDFLEFSIE